MQICSLETLISDIKLVSYKWDPFDSHDSNSVKISILKLVTKSKAKHNVA